MGSRYAFQPKGKGYTVYRTHTSPPRRHNNSKGPSAAFGAILIGLSVVVAAIWTMIKLALILLAVLLCVAAVALAVVGIRRWLRAITSKKAELERCRALINNPEPDWEGISPPGRTGYSSEEEQRINEAFRLFLEAKSTQMKAEKHLSYLREKRAALEHLKRSDEAAAMQEEIGLAEKAVRAAQSAADARRYRHEALTAARQKAFNAVIEDISHIAPGSLFGEFLSPSCRAIPMAGNTALYLTPACAIRFDSRRSLAVPVPYATLSLISDIKTEELKGLLKPGDEVAFTSWRYERKDGGPDLRYRDNPCYTYVYRGMVTLAAADFRVVIPFGNQSKTVAFVNKMQELAALLPCAPQV